LLIVLALVVAVESLREKGATEYPEVTIWMPVD
jgi:hypothetical protein